MTLPDLATSTWVWLMLAAFLIGVAKTALSGVASISVVIFAAILPARESTGALLPLLIVGDLLAVSLYRRHANWAALARLLPSVVPGILLGAWFVANIGDDTMRIAIGLILLALTGIQLLQRLRSKREQDPVSEPQLHPVATAAVGGTAGFTTMTANAAGPVMTLYLVMTRLPVLEIIGTGAWFYLVVNLLKLPFSVGLHLISGPSLAMDALLVPAMLVGGIVGYFGVRRMSQSGFEIAALALSAGSAALLLVPR